ncbi:carcinoembryonic antigen-related cell adhesion molecule 5-like [Carassius carassius]|uniref:carcinoembryonic antigen-related cell adhesion molecule 5-like n=1 Tax=Carassius carassius TaxID=217509 RepID=UPI00286975C2|nr:carcinoembryonic antigen-related cell adhesion molecule 5-like [Carassius carassius]
MGSSALLLKLLLMSLIYSGLSQGETNDTGTFQALPRSTLTVTPDSPVFTGEKVDLKCVIESDHSDWKYEWWKGNSNIQVSQRYTENTDTLTIEGSESSDAGQYWCRGHIEGRSVSTQSSSVSLSVKERPEAVVKVSPDQRVFRGETVTLTCDIQRGGVIQWRYSWFKDGDTRYPYRTTTTAEISFTAEVSDSGEYSCRGERSDSQTSHTSAALTLTVSDLPRSTLTVTPDKTVFTGERVSLTCVIESDHRDWRYEWWKGNTYYTSIFQSSERHTVNRNTLTIERSESSDAGQYTCGGQRDKRPNSSQSSSVYLSVTDLPRSTLTVTPDTAVFTGERVSLTCEIESNRDWRWRNGLTDRRYDWTPDWRYEWWKGSVKLQSSDRLTVNTDTLTITAVTTSDAGRYTCRGQRDKRPNSSQSSSAVSLSVTDLPTSTLTVDPESPVFTGERVRLKCVIESFSDWSKRNGLRYDQSYYWRYDWTSDWSYEWYKGSAKLQSSERYTVNTDTLTIRAVTTSDAGQYTCRGQRDKRPNSTQSSSAVSLSVTDLPISTLVVTPDSSVLTGETVNLTCVIDSNHSDWKYEWYKGGNNSVKLQSSERYTVNRDTLTIRGLNESDQDQYTCRGQRDGRPNSTQESERINLSVNVSAALSSLLVTGVVVGSSVCLLFFLSLLLMWRYKKNKDQQRNINQTSVPNQSAQSQLDNFPLQSADPDHIYDDVTTVKNRDKDDSEPLADVTYSEVKKKMDKEDTIADSNNVTYSEVGKRVKKCKSKDINTAGPSDLTYAEINIQDKKKTKGKGAGLSDVLIEMKSKEKHRGKSSESGDTLYSELKQNTDRDAVAGVGDTTYAQSIRKKNKTYAVAEVEDATYAQPIMKKNKKRKNLHLFLQIVAHIEYFTL